MKNYSVRLYNQTDYNTWNTFIDQAKNATFLFHRDFMEYHADRFQDYSLIILDGQKWVAVLPANIVGDTVFSHQGLTYGGIIFQDILDVAVKENIFDFILEFLSRNNVSKLVFKLIPDFYHLRTSKEIEYFLFKKNAKLLNRSMNLVIDYERPFNISKSKLKHFRKVSQLGMTFEETEDFSLFWNQILIPRLFEKHSTKPVHSLEEIKKLKLLFPKNIKQYNVFFDGEIVAGITLFCSRQVVKSQYGATSAKGEKIRALDYLFINLIYNYSSDFSFFDMGIVDSLESYNKGLTKQKEELGCSVSLQDVYEVKIL